MIQESLYQQTIKLLQQLIAIPAPSRGEAERCSLLYAYLKRQGVNVAKHLNNIWAKNRHFDPAKPTLLLNSHIDTVLPNKSYTLDPYDPQLIDGRLHGLGSNDAGGCVVSLIAAFLHHYDSTNLAYNLVLALTAEEEVSGKDGISAVLPLLGNIDCAIVGEPTQTQLAVAERGLMVLDCVAFGKAGHAARNEGINAIYHAVDDINWFRSYQFEKISELLGPVQMNVTQIGAGTQHNVIPDQCSFIVDCRINECYDFESVLRTIMSHVSCDVKPRSTRLRSTSIARSHPLVAAGVRMGRTCFGSMTMSDKALMPFPALKVGPGDSARSHTADEFIYLDEIRDGIDFYIQLINELK